jgi:hypothetical protein
VAGTQQEIVMSAKQSVSSSFEQLESRRMMSVVVPGGTVALPGTTAAAQPALAGVVVRDALIPFTVDDGIGHTIFKGTLQDRVVRENGSGTLDFYQTVRADAGFTIPAMLQYVSRSSFGGWGVDANFRTDGLGDPAIKPEFATRSADGTSVFYRFGNDRVDPGDQSLFYMAKTNAKAFDLNGGTAIGFGQGPTPGSGNGSVKLTTAAPVTPATPGSAGGVVWHDVNGDGVRQSAEPALANVRVFDDANHNGVFNLGENSVLTNPVGGYVLSGLSPGLHQVRVVNPAGTRVTRPATGVYNLIVPAGVHSPARDFGITRTVKIGGTVYNDVDSDGVRDAGEAGLSGFKVYLDANNNGVLDLGEKNVLTNAAGSYTFNGLAAGIHRVRVQPKVFYTPTAPATGVHTVALGSGMTASNRNFGEHFRPIIIDPIPLPIPLPLPLPRPLPIPQPIPIPIPNPDPGPLALL